MIFYSRFLRYFKTASRWNRRERWGKAKAGASVASLASVLQSTFLQEPTPKWGLSLASNAFVLQVITPGKAGGLGKP